MHRSKESSHESLILSELELLCKVGAPARSAALVPGIDCGADLVGQT